MALIKCKECQRDVSAKAEKCPHCGAPVQKKKSGCAMLFAIVAGVFIVEYFASLSGGGGSPTTSSPRSSSPPTDAQKERIRIEAKERVQRSLEVEMIGDAQRAIRRLMKDPDSVRFRDVQYGYSEETGAVAYGFVNSKNSLGAYSGFQRFVSNGKTTLLEERDSGLTDAWMKLQFAATTTRTLEELRSDAPISIPIRIDIKPILGKSRQEVEKLFGEASKTEEITEGLNVIYDTENIEIVFISGRADWVTVNGLDNIPFSPDAIIALGLERTRPTFASAHVLRWESIDGIMEVSIFRGEQNCSYAYIKTLTK